MFKLRADIKQVVPNAARVVAVEDEPNAEEAQEPKALTNPRPPSAAEIAQHEVSHLPYRNWCAHCVRGRGRSDDHPASGDREIHVVSLGYLFLGDDEGEMLTVLTMCDSNSGYTFASPVPSKGATHTHMRRRWWRRGSTCSDTARSA